jgi:hypothetical protein
VKRMPLLLSLLASMVLLVGCIAGGISRSKVLTPALNSATPRVVADAKLDPAADAVTLDEFQQDVSAGLWGKAELLWPQVRKSAEAGIKDRLTKGVIGPNVAQSLEERLVQYESDLYKMAGSVSLPTTLPSTQPAAPRTGAVPK